MRITAAEIRNQQKLGRRMTTHLIEGMNITDIGVTILQVWPYRQETRTQHLKVLHRCCGLTQVLTVSALRPRIMKGWEQCGACRQKARAQARAKHKKSEIRSVQEKARLEGRELHLWAHQQMNRGLAA